MKEINLKELNEVTGAYMIGGCFPFPTKKPKLF